MTLKWIWQNNRNQLAKVIIISILGIVNAVLGVLFALSTKYVVDAAVKGDSSEFKFWIFAAIGLMVTLLCISFFIYYTEEYARTSAENSLRHHVFANILNKDYKSIKMHHSGELLNRLFSDVAYVADSFISLIPCLVSMLVRLGCIGIVLFIIDWTFALVLVVGGVLMIGVSVLLRHKMKMYHTKVQESEGRMKSFFQEALESVIVIKSFFAQDNMGRIANVKMDDYMTIKMKRVKFSGFAKVGFSGTMSLATILGIAWCGYGILSGAMTYGTLLAVWQLISQIQAPINNISAIIPQYYAMTASANRLIELEEDKEAVKGLDKQDENWVREFETICGDKLSFSYDEDSDIILEDASFDIKRGEFVAITGVSGIGKSSLIKLMLGLYDIENGGLYIKKAENSIDVKDILKPVFAYVPQGNVLMSGTIKEIISMYDEKFDNERFERACENACVDTFAKDFPKGYDTYLGEKGQGVSEGQMQRIAIARALYFDLPVLLLDESTSALDEQTELAVLKNLKALNNKTVIIITHRSAALNFCDRRVTISNKKIIED